MTKTTAVATLNSKKDAGSGQVSLGFNADYNDERNKEWAKYTPGLGVQMTVTDAVAEQFEQGGRYLLTFDRAEGKAEIPEGYEPAEHSAAKNHALDALASELEKQGIADEDEGGPALIELADVVVEALIAAGVTIPEDISDPHAIHKV